MKPPCFKIDVKEQTQKKMNNSCDHKKSGHGGSLNTFNSKQQVKQQIPLPSERKLQLIKLQAFNKILFE